MESTALISLGVLLIVAGLAILAASYRISRLARSYRRRMETLLQLASQPLDPLDIPAAAWPELSAGGWRTVSWEGLWFGQPVAGSLGCERRPNRKPAVPPLNFNLVSGDDVKLNLSLIHSQSWGENRLFAEHLARVFVLLLETRLHARTEALAAALAERARLSLYLQHDMRNLAQWVLWVSTDFGACDSPESMLTAANRLRDNAPLAKERADRLIRALGKQTIAENPSLIDLRLAAIHAARLAGVEPTISGEASAWVAAGQLARALDNLFTNLAASWREPAPVSPQLQLTTTTIAGRSVAKLEFFCPWLPGITPLPPEKIFEPFASGRAGGLGLGLYQARKSLREAGGDLTATILPEGLCFLLHLPARAP
jgi:signal transduction histidine kinase